MGQGNQAAVQLDSALLELNDVCERVLGDHGGARGRARRILARAARIERGEALDDDVDADAQTTGAPAGSRRRAAAATRRKVSAEQRMANRVQQLMHRGGV